MQLTKTYLLGEQEVQSFTQEDWTGARFLDEGLSESRCLCSRGTGGYLLSFARMVWRMRRCSERNEQDWDQLNRRTIGCMTDLPGLKG